MLKEKNCAVMKKFFVKKEFRSKKVGLALYKKLLEFAKEKRYNILFWIRPEQQKLHIGFMKRQVFIKLIKHSCRFRIRFRIERVFFISLICQRKWEWK